MYESNRPRRRETHAAVVLGLLAWLALSSPGAAAPASETVFVGGAVYTMDTAHPRAEAVAVSGSLIVDVGDEPSVRGKCGKDAGVVHLRPGEIVLPGLIDAHGHLHSLGRSIVEVRLFGTRSREECAERVRERQRSTPPGRWIRGRGWDQNDWEETTFPTAGGLQGTEANPVYLVRVDGHAAWLNRKALEVCGITRDTPDPEGGRVVRDGHGEPTGVLVDNAKELATAKMPDPSPEELDHRMRAAVDDLIRFGLVGVGDAGTTADELASLERLAARGELPLRVYSMLDGEQPSLLSRFLAAGPSVLGGGRIVVRSVKMYADGALGSRGAALLEPYDDDPGNRGLLVTPPDSLYSVARRALAAGFQMCTHAIGDGGNRVTLDAYERALREVEGAVASDHRFRIEHCQVVNNDDFARFEELGVIPSMQPTHATSDMYWAEKRIGPERILGAYAWRRFLDAGNPLPLGSDFPVESANPLLGIYAAVTRTDAEGWPEGGWYPDQRLTVEEAVRGFTASAAYAEFAEDVRGTIEPGKYADLVVLDRDIFTCDPREIREAKVVLTMVGGEVVYRSDRADD
jgi:predicted amidohydrolase YtcJ